MELLDFKNFDDIYFKKYEGWDEAPATVWDTHTDEETTEPRPLAWDDNPYKVMNQFAFLGLTREAILAVRGWAAPLEAEDINNKIRPSLHPDKVRVVIYLHLKKGCEVLSVAMHQQDKDIIIIDSHATGDMADAIFEAVKIARKQLKILKKKKNRE